MPDLSGFKRDVVGAYIEKDPDAELAYTVDWTDWMPAGSSLSTVSFATSGPAGDADPLVVGSESIVADKAVVTLRGGTDGTVYTVKCDIETDNGELDTRRFRVQVRARYL